MICAIFLLLYVLAYSALMATTIYLVLIMIVSIFDFLFNP